MYKEYVACADPTGCGTGNEALAWDYQVGSSCCVWIIMLLFFVLQACTELWMDSSTNNDTDMFPPHVFNSTTHCQMRWNVMKRPKWIITEFWGKGKSIPMLAHACAHAHIHTHTYTQTRIHYILHLHTLLAQ